METELRGVGGGGGIASRVSVKRIDSSRALLQRRNCWTLEAGGALGIKETSFCLFVYFYRPRLQFPWNFHRFSPAVNKRKFRSHVAQTATPNPALTLCQKVKSTSTFQLVIFNRSSLRYCNYQTVCAPIHWSFLLFKYISIFRASIFVHLSNSIVFRNDLIIAWIIGITLHKFSTRFRISSPIIFLEVRFCVCFPNSQKFNWISKFLNFYSSFDICIYNSNSIVFEIIYHPNQNHQVSSQECLLVLFS